MSAISTRIRKYAATAEFPPILPSHKDAAQRSSHGHYVGWGGPINPIATTNEAGDPPQLAKAIHDSCAPRRSLPVAADRTPPSSERCGMCRRFERFWHTQASASDERGIAVARSSGACWSSRTVGGVRPDPLGAPDRARSYEERHPPAVASKRQLTIGL